MEIKLTQGKVALVSDEDADKVAPFIWYATNNPRRSMGCSEKWYARNSKLGYLHRYLMGNPKGMVVDHINGDSLDNRRENLRIVTAQENLHKTQFKRFCDPCL